jgi:hypothetical protein
VPGAFNSTISGSGAVALSLIRALDQLLGRPRAVPETVDNVSLLGHWMAAEGGLWANNPLNTSLDAGALPHQFTPSGQDTGIPIFPTMSAGIAATAATLVSNPSYARIVHLLATGRASCPAFARAVIRSPWASGHYGHHIESIC